MLEGLRLRRTARELANQLRQDIKEIVGSSAAERKVAQDGEEEGKKEEEEGKEEEKKEKTIAAEKEKSLQQQLHMFHYRKTRKNRFLETGRLKTRLARFIVISAAVVYAYSFVAHPAALLGFGAALFDLFVGLETIRPWIKESVLQSKGRKKRKSFNGDVVGTAPITSTLTTTHTSTCNATATTSTTTNRARYAPSWVERTHAYMWAKTELQERLRLAASGVAVTGSSSSSSSSSSAAAATTTTKARKYLNVMFASAPAMVLGAGLSSATLHPYLIFIAIIPGAIIAIPFLSLKLKKAQRGEIEEELPFFLILAEMFALVEKPLIHAFEALARSDLLSKMHGEAEIVRRDVNAFGYTPDQAIDNLAASHPNAEFRALLRDYLGSVSLGQSASQYFKSKAETYLSRLEARYERFRENAGTAGEVVLIALMIVPITGIMYGTSGSVSGLVLVGTIPLIAAGVFFMLDRAQVKGPDSASNQRPQVFPVAAGAFTAVILLVLLQVEFMTALFVSVAAFAIPHGIVVRRRIKYEDELLLELAQFIRAVSEGMKTGLDVTSAIRHTGADGFLVLNAHLRRIKYWLATNGTLDGAFVNPTMRLSQQQQRRQQQQQNQQQAGFYIKYAVFVMSALAASGAASYAMLDRLAEYLGRIREQSAKVKKSVAVYGFLVVVSPLFMMFTIHAMESISSFARTEGEGEAGIAPGSLYEIQFQMHLAADSPTVQLMYFFTTLCAGALGGKIANQTIRDTLPLGIACIIALASPTVLEMLWPLAP